MTPEGLRFDPNPERLARLRGQVEAVAGRARERFASGAECDLIARELSCEIDQCLVETLQDTFALLAPDQKAEAEQTVALLAVGGSGRGEPAPFSDVDLLFLVDPSVSPTGRAWLEQVIRDFWDSGWKLGHSVRTIDQCLAAAGEDHQVATSLIETRRLWGSDRLHQALSRSFATKFARPRWKSCCAESLANRIDEREKHGGAVLSLVPDVKRACGGLRDWQLVRWLTFWEFGTPDPEALVARGVITEGDLYEARHAVKYLCRIRTDLHFEAGHCQDVLTRDEQLRLAAKFGFQETAGQRPVERFMRHYFERAMSLWRLARRLELRHARKPLKSKLIGLVDSPHKEKDGFRVGRDGIDVTPVARDKLLSDSDMMLRLFYLAAMYNQPPKPDLLDSVRQALPSLTFRLTPQGARRFREILARSLSLETVLRLMNETGLLERIVPDVSNARFLLQFNQYHSYTVDEHTFRAIGRLCSLRHDPGELGQVYRSIRHPEVVHLAMLLHDLGKGFEEDHSEVGKRIAERIGEQLRFSPVQREQLALLVHKHLLMPNTAFWRDTTDPRVLLAFSRDVGSVETLKMLYVLTAADVWAVGPGVWTDWKAELLSGLYQRALQTLSGDGGPLQEERVRAERKREIMQSLLRDTSLDPVREEEWVETEIETLPLHYLLEHSARDIAADLERVALLKPGRVLVEGAYQAETELVEYRIYLAPELAAGCFHRIAGGLSALRMEILAAHICTTTRGVVVDRFTVKDNDFEGEVPIHRIDEVGKILAEIIRGERPLKPLLSRKSRFASAGDKESYANQPTKLVVDNDSSDRCTVVDVFTRDRRGLLHALARAIFEEGLSVELARIGTHLEQVVDVFYLTDEQGRKLEDKQRLDALREKLATLLEGLENGEDPLDFEE
jgi:[protein-PII] uridylyltransferase